MTLRIIKITAILFFLCFTLAQARGTDSFTGEVVGITDGDTIRVIHGGKAAKRFASDLAFGKKATVETHGKDVYRRTLGTVILPDGRNLNYELVRAGLAWWFRRYSNDSTLGRLEGEARAARRGLWTDKNPIPPWEWRRENRH